MQNGSLRGPREDPLPNAIQEDLNRSALHEAASIGDEKTLQALLAAGADRNAKDLKHGNTPLHEAAWKGVSRCVKLLCELPHPKSAKDVKESKIKGVLQDTRGALHSALLGTRNAGGFSALHLAAQNGHNQSCREILLAGADPDVQNNYGDTPLHTACRYGHAGATRILISAKCDLNRTNLNGDTPLHISCAMGRRKLTRILLEAGGNLETKNAQDETPRDIAVRKNLSEILEILNNPAPAKPAKDRDRSSSNSKNADKTDGHKSKSKRTDFVGNPVNWSPYGCHYFPDPRTFPSPKLETLPKEPLAKGEQYYLDLAGNIRKGPIGVGNTCYCGPFFRHIEERISRNRKSIRKYVHKATERLDNKVQALALRTDDQIEQLTRSMMAERIKCEGRRLHIEQWLRRGEPTRTTIGHHSKSKKNIENVNTLTRCRSLELLDEDDCLSGSRKIQNSRSFDMLDEAEVTVHRNPEPSDDQRENVSFFSSDRRTSRNSEKSKSSGCETSHNRNSYSVSKRLEELLEKTNEILEMEKVMRRRPRDGAAGKHKSKENERVRFALNAKRHSSYEDELLAKFKKSVYVKENVGKDVDSTEFITHEMNKITNSLGKADVSSKDHIENIPPLSPEISKDFTSKKELERKSDPEHEKSSIVSGSSQKNLSSPGSGYVPDFSNLRSQRNRSRTRDPSNKSLSESESRPSPVVTGSYSQEYQNITEAHDLSNEKNFKDLLSALRRDYQATKKPVDSKIQEANVQRGLHSAYGQDFLPNSVDIVDSAHVDTIQNGYCKSPVSDDSHMSPNNTFKRQASVDKSLLNDPEDTIELSEMANVDEMNELKSRILNGSSWKSQVLKKNQQMVNDELEEQNSKGINGIVQKFEIKNSEIKTLKSPTSGILKRSKVQQLVAKIQGSSDDSANNLQENSESSEEEPDDSNLHLYANKDEHFDNIANSYYYYNRAQPQVAATYQHESVSGYLELPPKDIGASNSRVLDTRNLIPKDAYFHELPNKNRMRPIVDKLPEKQMINFANQYENTHTMMARTRNPLPYYEYDISASNTAMNGAHIECPEPRDSPIPQHVRQMPLREKLLSHRKFAFSSAVDYELSRISYNQQQLQQHQHLPPHIQSTVSITPEQAQVERDNNNDSGYSTKICGSSHGPSPSLSGHTDYGANTIVSGDFPGEQVDQTGVTYFIGNVGASSLV